MSMYYSLPASLLYWIKAALDPVHSGSSRGCKYIRLFIREPKRLQRSEVSCAFRGRSCRRWIYDEVERRVITFAVRVGVPLGFLDPSWIGRLQKSTRGNDGRCI